MIAAAVPGIVRVRRTAAKEERCEKREAQRYDQKHKTEKDDRRRYDGGQFEAIAWIPDLLASVTVVRLVSVEIGSSLFGLIGDGHCRISQISLVIN